MIARRLFVLTQLLLVAHLTAPLVAAQDAVPALIQVSGELIDQKGKPLTGQQTVMFALYKEQSDKAPLWVESQVVAADAKGRFIALLGATSPTGLPVDLFSTGQARWLGMQAAGQAEQARSFLASVPYALAPLSALSSDSKTGEAVAGSNPPAGTSTLSTTQLAPSAAATLASPPTSPVFTVVADATSGLTSTPSNNGATVTLTLIKSCATGQLLKWNGTAWSCTADTDVKIGVTGGGLNVLANPTSPNIVGGFGGNRVAPGISGGTVSGGGQSGLTNRVMDSFGTVAGGLHNQAGDTTTPADDSQYATVGGGANNIASALKASVAGGGNNVAEAEGATIAGGERNFADGIRATIAGGEFNQARSRYSTVGGGDENSALGLGATVPGGLRNTATGEGSFAAGISAQAGHSRTFVWNDSDDTFQSTSSNQFLIHAGAGVGINTRFLDPSVAALTVQGNVKATKFIGDGSMLTNLPPTGLIGTGSVNYLTKFTSPNSVSNSVLFDNGIALGIGTSDPDPMVKLEVDATGGTVLYSGLFQNSTFGGAALGGIYRNVDSNGGIGVIGRTFGKAGWGVLGRGDGGSLGGGVSGDSLNYIGVFGNSHAPSGIGGYFRNADTGGKALVAVTPDGDEVLTVRASGSIGIRNTDPTEALDVSGNVKATKFIGDGSMLTNLPSTAGGTITGVTPTSGGGLTGGGTTGDVSLSIAPNGVTNSMLVNDSLRLNPGPGLTDGGAISLGGSGTLSVNFLVVQRRLSGNCVGLAGIQSINFDGTVFCGGFGNIASGLLAAVGGGDNNQATGQSSTISGGAVNIASDLGSTIGGGDANKSTGRYTTIGGGTGNKADGDGSTVAGGESNRASGFSSTVAGGSSNTAIGFTSFAAGYNAHAVTDRSFVWNSSSGLAFTSTLPDQFLIHADGGVGIGTPSPTQALDVVGNVKADGLCISTDCRTAWPSGAGGGTITSVVAGNGLAGGGSGGSVTLGIPLGGITNAMLQNSAVTLNTPAGSGLTGGGSVALGSFGGSSGLTLSILSGGVTNAMLQHPSIDLNLSPISGLTGGGTIALGSAAPLSVDFTSAQKRVFQDCGAGRAIRSVNQDGSAACETVVSTGLTGTGGINFLTKFSGPNSIGGSVVFDDGSKVGIGTTSPIGKLHVDAGNGGSIGGLFQTSASGGTALSAESFDTSDINVGISGVSHGSGGFGVIGRGTLGVFGRSADSFGFGGYFQNDDAVGKALVAVTNTGAEALTVRSSGNVGILNASPTEALDVNGNVKANGLCIGTDCRTAWPSGGGTGTITGVTALAGLTGGGTSGSVSLSIANSGVTNAMLQNSAVTVSTPAGNGLTGGGSVSLGGNLALSIDTTVVPRLATTNNFTASQNVNIAAITGAINATNTAPTGAAFGVVGQSASAAGRGVFGSATATTGGSAGVLGQSASTSGTGVSGTATATTGATFGGFFTTASPNGIGVRSLGGITGVDAIGGGTGINAQGSNASGATFGVNASAASPNGIAVQGSANASTGSTIGGNFVSLSPSGTGVNGQGGSKGLQGLATASTGVTYGVFGSSVSPTGYGVYSQGDAHVEGNLSYSGTLTQSSSRRWKTNITPMIGALAKVEQLQGVTYDWKDSGRHDIGLIAEDVHAVVPEVVLMEANGVDAKGVDYARLTSLLIEAVKEQQREIRQLHELVETLRATIGTDEARATRAPR